VGLVHDAFGLATLVLVLATLAAIPIVQLLALGYLLEAEGRVARTGKLRGSLPGLDIMARAGGVLLGTFLVFLPALVVLDFQHDAALVDPASRTTGKLAVWGTALASLATVQSFAAIARGGKLRWFFRPIENARWLLARVGEGGSTGAAFEAARAFVPTLRLGHYWKLGLKGFVAALAWILLPTALLAVGYKVPPLGLLGALALALAVIPLPLLQARLAAEGRLAAGFELREAWARYRAAPVSALVALFLTLALAVPLYAFKVERIPQDARWLPAVVMLLTVLPTKLAAGKAYARGSAGGRANILLRFASAAIALPLSLAYVGILFVTPFFGWRGAAGLFEQHAFLVPVAFY
jgi:hypothetical protein